MLFLTHRRDNIVNLAGSTRLEVDGKISWPFSITSIPSLQSSSTVCQFLSSPQSSLDCLPVSSFSAVFS